MVGDSESFLPLKIVNYVLQFANSTKVTLGAYGLKLIVVFMVSDGLQNAGLHYPEFFRACSPQSPLQ